MEWKEMKNASPEALRKELDEALAQLRGLRSQLSAHQLARVREVREVRRQIARLKTLLRQKELATTR